MSGQLKRYFYAVLALVLLLGLGWRLAAAQLQSDAVDLLNDKRDLLIAVFIFNPY